MPPPRCNPHASRAEGGDARERERTLCVSSLCGCPRLSHALDAPTWLSARLLCPQLGAKRTSTMSCPVWATCTGGVLQRCPEESPGRTPSRRHTQPLHGPPTAAAVGEGPGGWQKRSPREACCCATSDSRTGAGVYAAALGYGPARFSAATESPSAGSAAARSISISKHWRWSRLPSSVSGHPPCEPRWRQRFSSWQS